MNITSHYLSRAETWLIITTLIYFLMNGAQIFETAAIVPKFAAAPPESLHLFRGPYGLDFKTFWIIFHTIHEITFILAIIFCWRIEPLRNWLLILFAIHFAARVWTLAYFAPNIMDFQRIANEGTDAPGLAARTALWQSLNYIRVAIFIAVSIGLIPLCIKLMNMKATAQ